MNEPITEQLYNKVVNLTALIKWMGVCALIIQAGAFLLTL